MFRLFGAVSRLILALGLALITQIGAFAQTNPGNAISLNGTDYFRTTTWSGGLFKNDTFTFEFWFKAATPGVLVGEADTADTNVLDVAFAEVFAGGLIKAGAPGVPTVTVGSVAFHSWHHLAVVYNETNDTLAVYLDGNLSVTSIGDRIRPEEIGRSAVYPFGRGGPRNLGGGGFLRGEFDEVRIWNVARSSAEIQANYRKIIETPMTGLLGYWQFDTTSGSNSPDKSGSGNPALYVPVDRVTPLVPSGAPLEYPLELVRTETASVTRGEVTLNARANPRGNSLTVYFEWGPTSAFGNRTPSQNLGTGNVEVLVTETLNDLAPGEYFYRAIGLTAEDIVYGTTERFEVTTIGGKALVLTGSDFVRTTLWSPQLFPDENFSFELWVNPSGPGVLISEVDTADPKLWDYAFAEILATRVLRIGVPGVPPIDLGPVELSTWHHVAVVYDQSQKRLFGYVNGVLKGSSAGDRQTPREAGRTSVYAFGRGGPSNLGGGRWFVGRLDEIRIWRIPRSEEEISSSYDKALILNSPNQMGHWRFDRADGNGSPDDSGKNNPAVYVPENGNPQFSYVSAPLVEDRRPSVLQISGTDLNRYLVELQALVDSRGEETTVFFEYGINEFISRTDSQQIPQGSRPVTVTSILSELETYERYQYRLVASNRFGVVATPIQIVQKTGVTGYNVRLLGNAYLRTSSAQRVFFPKDDITLEMWFKPEKAGVLASEVNFGNLSQLDRSTIEILPSGSIEAGFEGLVPISSNGRATYNAWNHVALRYDGANQEMTLFLNGTKSSQTSTGDRLAPGDRLVPVFFAFGRAARVKLGTGEAFHGQIEELRFWSVARTDAQLQSARSHILTGAEAGLVGYWRFEEHNTDTIADFSFRGNTGVKVGGERVVSDAPLQFNVVPIQRRSESDLQLEFIGRADASYRLEGTKDFQTWTLLAKAQAYRSGSILFKTPFEGSFNFFRVVPE